MIYLDNCSTTHKKPKCVYKAFKKGIKTYSVNAGRGSYKLAVEANLKILEFRENVCSFFNAPNPEQVIITKNCTESINLILRGSIKPNGHIIVSTFEHNSVLRTLDYLSKNHNISFSIVKPKNKNGEISIEELQKHIKPQTYLIFINHTSNIFGATQNIKKIGNLCKKHNLLFGVDVAQSAGHEQIDMQNFNINFLAVAGHKGLYGAQGIGLAIINDAKLSPIIFGGTGTNSESIVQPLDFPEGFESGTLNFPSILSLNAGINFVRNNQEKINNKISKLTKYLIENLKLCENLELYYSSIKSGVVSFKIKNKENSEVCSILDQEFNIAVRCGLHCAPLAHEFLGSKSTGLIRIGISYFNSIRDIKKIIRALTLISSNFY